MSNLDYNINYECRYHKSDVFLPTDDISNAEKDEVRDFLYREDLLEIFNCNTKMLDNDFNTKLHNLYEKIKNYTPLHKILEIAASYLMETDHEVGLYILYSYDYMHITHKCISEYLVSDSISKNNIDDLCKYVQK